MEEIEKLLKDPKNQAKANQTSASVSENPTLIYGKPKIPQRQSIQPIPSKSEML